MKLIIIEGSTSTGKSTLARRLSKELRIPAFLKDDYKEAEFDKRGGTPGWNQMQAIERDSWQEIYLQISRAVRADSSLIVEANFFWKQRRHIRPLLTANTVVIEILCYARGYTIFRRYVKRNRQGERHPGHRDHLWYPLVALEGLVIETERYLRPLRLTRHLLKVNTTRYDKIDYRVIKRFIKQAR